MSAAADSVPLATQPWDVARVPGEDVIAPAWRGLEAAASVPTHHFIWARSCAESFSKTGSSHFVTVSKGDRLTAVAPLTRTHGPVPRLELMGVRELFEPTDFLYDGPTALEDLAQRLADQPLALLLMRLPASSPVPAALKRAFRGRGLVRAVPINPCPFIDLDASWADPEARFNSGRRSDFRRMRRHAEQMGPLTFEVLSPAPEEVDALLDEAFAVEESSWKGDNGSALARDPVIGGFFRRYAVAAAAQGILRLVFMRIAGRAVAMQIALECQRRFWLLKIGYDDGVSKCSPGNQLILHTVKYAVSRGLISYEFLGGVAPWTDFWTRTLRGCTAVRAYPFTTQGMAALAMDGGQWVRRYIERRRSKPE